MVFIVGCSNSKPITKLNNDILHYVYFDKTINLPVYTLSSGKYTYYFADGVLFGINGLHTNKISVGINDNPLTGIDIIGTDKDKKGFTVFALYRQAEDTTPIEVSKTDNSIEFTKQNSNGAVEKVLYTVNNNMIKTIFTSNSNDRYAVRLNFIGDNKQKAITKWDGKHISNHIIEPLFDNSDTNYINQQYDNIIITDFKHKDIVYNDRYPYYNTRRFLTINENTEFILYGESGEKYIIKDIIGTNDFFYKNCTGEEGFAFGARWPYANPVRTIKNKFEMTMAVY